MPELEPQNTAIEADDFRLLLSQCLPHELKERFFPRSIALAVSGGADSTALALCCARWADKNTSALIAFIIDHRLRPESTDEAHAVMDSLRHMGIKSEILAWEHGTVTSAVHATARKARYDLLQQACVQHKREFLLLGHHADDQAETILMRLAKGSGIDGLAGMYRAKLYGGIYRVRPFLTVPKSRLIATCTTAGHTFADDKSNQSTAYARGRLRSVMPLLADEGFTPTRLTELGQRAAHARQALDHYTSQLLRSSVRHDTSGALSVDLIQWRTHPIETCYRALTHCLEALSHQNYAPRYRALFPIVSAALAPTESWQKTLHGVVLKKNGHLLELIREVSAIPTNCPIEGSGQIWDHRWQLMFPDNCDFDHLCINPLGNPPLSLLDNLSPELRAAIPQGQKRASLPSLWDGKRLVNVPGFTEKQNSFWIRLSPHITANFPT